VIVIDTTVWVDFFAGRAEKPHVAELLRLVDADAGVALTDIILGEILQGLRGEHTVRRVDQRLTAFDILRLRTLDDFRNAAALYRHARSKGKTIRRTLDCLIATVCIREDCAILHNDRDFDHLAAVTDLVVHLAPESAGSDVD
jgi:hypothetical protein